MLVIQRALIGYLFCVRDYTLHVLLYLILTQLSEKVEEVSQFVQGPEPRAVQPRISQDKLDSAAITADLQVLGLKNNKWYVI